MRLEHLMTLRAELEPPVDVGAGPSGSRRIFDVTGGTFEGPELSGTVAASGGDWLLIGADGVGRLDVRATLRTDDDALVYVQYFGVVEFNEAVVTALAEGLETAYGDTRFFTQPRFETGDERYAWLNAVVAVGEGRVIPDAVEYRIARVRSD